MLLSEGLGVAVTLALPLGVREGSEPTLLLLVGVTLGVGVPVALGVGLAVGSVYAQRSENGPLSEGSSALTSTYTKREGTVTFSALAPPPQPYGDSRVSSSFEYTQPKEVQSEGHPPPTNSTVSKELRAREGRG